MDSLPRHTMHAVVSFHCNKSWSRQLRVLTCMPRPTTNLLFRLIVAAQQYVHVRITDHELSNGPNAVFLFLQTGHCFRERTDDNIVQHSSWVSYSTPAPPRTRFQWPDKGDSICGCIGGRLLPSYNDHIMAENWLRITKQRCSDGGG